jgi:hypothetical protein
MIKMNNPETLHMNINKYEQELLALHKQVITAHLDKDVEFFIKDIADDYFSVSRGKLTRYSKDDIIQMFSNYFGSTEFKVYEDLMDPIVKVSDDGSLGWSIVQVKIKAVRVIDDTKHEINEVWTWITLYKRENDIWIRMGEVSSTKPE